MKNFNNIDEILHFAINSEQESVDFYTRLSGQARNQEMKQIFVQYAHEEMSHKARLISIRDSGQIMISTEKVDDLKISDYLVDVLPGPDLTYAEALVVAMKKEKAAFRLYLDLAERTENQDIKDVFMTLAQEESKHKLRFEIEYDQHVLREN
ncbi:ferritin family protein [Lentimicrobium sp.]|jgi:rubrerythrin|uniref:ferritin family protein n=1 Tax=Lentimicrobium sp. TaxID=2034841 RepID=UPI002CE63535|nr:ferritin family protein [Lentimicrobium sp.]MCO5262151.1 ferritin family protein [Lentimicrobium sp.]HPF63534.1 ferritin family protein [Lentimicrobium sp.]HPJ61521.1 ferritin family protein [Lentimicrobium sp.]HPR24942.1 ferritin family protein [Lentimicrobium sp.]HRW68161.1 ferritin family protein [Lentimicrobium sp.]